MIHQNNNGWKALSHHDHKPLELYLFIDPLCSNCWQLDPIIKKLQIEYGHYFSLTYVLSGKLKRLNPVNLQGKREDKVNVNRNLKNNCINSFDETNFDINLSSPFLASIAIKAAELQGRKSGIRFLRKLQESLYFKNKDITEIDILIECAQEANLDVEEFKKDIHSTSTSHAFQCDLKITNEMDVEEIPTVVFFNARTDEEGIKISGVNPYEVYIEIIKEILGEEPINHPLPSLLSFIKHYRFVTTKEIAFVFNCSYLQVEIEMKKLKLLQEVTLIETPIGSVWYYIGGDNPQK